MKKYITTYFKMKRRAEKNYTHISSMNCMYMTTSNAEAIMNYQIA